MVQQNNQRREFCTMHTYGNDSKVIGKCYYRLAFYSFFLSIHLFFVRFIFVSVKSPYASTSMAVSDDGGEIVMPMLDVVGWGVTIVSPKVGVTPGFMVRSAE